MADQGPNSLLTTGKNEYTKSHYVYDGVTGYLLYSYDARSNVGNGQPCLVTKYHYDASGRVVNRLEFAGLWDSSWDMTSVVD